MPFIIPLKYTFNDKSRPKAIPIQIKSYFNQQLCWNKNIFVLRFMHVCAYATTILNVDFYIAVFKLGRYRGASL